MRNRFNDDNQLFDAIMDHNEQAIKQYHNTIIQPLYGFAYKRINNKDAAFDIATDAFNTTLQSGVKFISLKHIAHYMYNNARYKCKDYFKRKAIPLPDVPLENIEDTVAGDENVEDDITRSEYRKAIYKQIDALPGEKDRCILLLTLQSKKPAEIASELSCSDEYVRNRLKRLAEIIRNELINKKIIIGLILFFLLIGNV